MGKQVFLSIFVIALLLNLSHGDIEDTIQNLDINSLQTNLTEIANSLNPEEAEKLLQEKCRKISGSDEAFEKAKVALKDAEQCIRNHIDVNILQEEMNNAKPTGNLDVVFKKYCQKSPQLKSCIFSLTNAYEPCMEPAEIETKKTVINVTDSLVDFICFKDGDRIALFIAEGGPECLNSSAAGVKECVESVFNIKLDEQAQLPKYESLPLLLLRSEECDKFTKLQKCVVAALEKCSEPTPSNIFDSLFNFIRRHTPCKAEAAESKSDSAGDGNATYGSFVLLITATIISFVYV